MLEECKQFLYSVKTNKLNAKVPGIVLSELVWLLQSYYGLNKKQTTEALSSILQLRGLEFIDEYNYRAALSLYAQNNTKYIDCLIASLVNKYEDGAIVSYDKDFDKLGVARKEPSQMLAKIT